MAPFDIVERKTAESNEFMGCETNAKMSLDNIPEKLRVFCYTCNTTVDGKNLPHHLLFGRLDCKFCTAKIATCERFHDVYYSKKLSCKHSKSGNHEFLKWQTSCAEYLSYFLRKELVIERFCQNKKGSPSSSEILSAVNDYISNLTVLENYSPWDIGLKSCGKYLESKRLHLKPNPNENKVANVEPTKTSSEDCNEPQSRDKINISTHGKLMGKSSNTPLESNCLKSKVQDIVGNTSETQRESDSREGMKSPCGEQSTCASKSFSLQESTKRASTKKCPSQGKKNGISNDSRGKTLLRQEVNIHEPEDSDEGLLQTFNIERLDQAVEYVTVEDDCREKGITEVSEVPSAIFQEGDQERVSAVQEISFGKRKASDDDNFCLSKISRKCHKSHSPSDDDFKPPDEIADDHYLVIHFPTEGCPDECPNCYCEFCPSMLTVNCSTFVSTIICAECNLTIYVLPD